MIIIVTKYRGKTVFVQPNTTKYIMTPFEHELYNTIVNNALLFLKGGATSLLVENKGTNTRDIVILSIANLQISLELAMRAFMIREKGMDSIVDQGHAHKQNKSIEQLYSENNLKVNEFEKMHRMFKGKDIDILTSEDLKIVDKFQTYRNKIVHMCCRLDDDSLSELKEELIYYMVQIVIRLLYDNYDSLTPAEYLEDLLGIDFYMDLWNSDGYRKAIETLANERAEVVGVCPICGMPTYDVKEKLCYFCNSSDERFEMGRTDCQMCGGKGTVIYDTLNIHNSGNHHTISGLCQCCEEHPYIFECPICGQTHWESWKNYDATTCTDGHCATKNIDYNSGDITEPLF